MSHPSHNGDALSWSVEQVQQWATDTFSFGTTLAAALVANDVDGSILLRHVTEATLKEDVGITSLGQRIKVLERIAELQLKCGPSLNGR